MRKTTKTIEALDKIADIVLAYRPKPKSKKAQDRQEKRNLAIKERKKRESTI